ncbi:MAG TPA: CARDB domain-containing protein [Conexibacter sp.]|jgi:hypothetical protein
MTRAGLIKRAVPVAAMIALAAGLPAASATADVTGMAAQTKTPGSGARVSQLKQLGYEAKMLQCRRSPRVELRMATVGAAMSPVPGGRKLSLRVDLYQRGLQSGHWALRTDVPGLGVWTSPSDPTIGTRPTDVFRYRQAVGRLIVPYAFRFRVSFRWSDATTGRVVRDASVFTSPCKQPDDRPDLTITDIEVDQPTSTTDSARYLVTVKNIGRTSAWNVGVAASFSAPQRAIKRLDPFDSVQLIVPGPQCTTPDGDPVFTVDPANTIDESRETNNSLVATCPATLDGP